MPFRDVAIGRYVKHVPSCHSYVQIPHHYPQYTFDISASPSATARPSCEGESVAGLQIAYDSIGFRSREAMAMSKSKTQYRIWRCLEFLILAFEVFLMVFLSTPLLVLWGLAKILDSMLHGLATGLDRIFLGLHLPFNFSAGLTSVRISNAVGAAIDYIFVPFNMLRTSCQCRSLQLQIANRGPKPSNGVPLTIDGCYGTQTSSPFCSLLPREIRDKIYEQYLLIDGAGLRLEVVRRPRVKGSPLALHGVPFSFGNARPESCTKCAGSRHRRHCDALKRITLPEGNRGRGRLGMLRTCKFVYTEMIKLLYSKPCGL